MAEPIAAPDVDWPTLRPYVLIRDGGCVFRSLKPGHRCRDRFGRPFAPSASVLYADVELDHVWTETNRVGDGAGGAKGKKAPDDPLHLVVVCWAAPHGDGHGP